MYPVYRVDADGQKLSGANRYTLTFRQRRAAARPCVLVAHHV